MIKDKKSSSKHKCGEACPKFRRPGALKESDILTLVSKKNCCQGGSVGHYNQTDNNIRALYESGYTPEEIAEKLGTMSKRKMTLVVENDGVIMDKDITNPLWTAFVRFVKRECERLSKE